MLVDLLIAVSCGAAGLLCGWLAYPAIFKAGLAEAATADVIPVNQTPLPVVDREQARLTEIANRLTQLMLTVAARVNRHQTELQHASELVREFDHSRDPSTLLVAMNRLLDASESMRDELADTQRKLDEQNQLLQTAQHRAMTDPLTQLANRQALDDYLAQHFQSSKDQSTTLMLLDIDYFKAINDQYGHLAGDAVLRFVASKLQEFLPNVGLISRYGGEEFVVVFENQGLADCIERAETARVELARYSVVFEGRPLRVTASAGLAECAPDERYESVDRWFEAADKALYASKIHRNCAHFIRDEKPIRATFHNESDAISDSDGIHSEQLDITVSDTETLSREHLPRFLQGIPIGERLYEEFAAVQNAHRGSALPFVIATIRIDKETITKADLQVVSRNVRSVVRVSDRMGMYDARTFVVAMPNLDHETAILKADRIRANCLFALDSENEIGRSDLTVSIALCSNYQRQTFAEMLRLGMRLLEKTSDNQRNRTVVAW